MTENLLLVPLDDTVVFPNMHVTLAIDAGDEERERRGAGCRGGPAGARVVRLPERGHRRRARSCR